MQEEFMQKLKTILEEESIEEYVFLCIGINKIKGDSLGPFIGTKLKENIKSPVYGTLDENICYTNIKRYERIVKNRHPNAIVIVIDAALSSKEAVGKIYITKGATKLGQGLEKGKVEIGDISIKAVVAENQKKAISNFLELKKVSNMQIQRLSRVIINGVTQLMQLK